jgi:glutamate/tyrosine decarboxylase-like PLP-dependent enzyme
MTDEPRATREDPGPLLARTAEIATEFLRGVPERPVLVHQDVASLRAAIVTPLPEAGEDPLEIIERLARDADPGIVSMAGPRYFGYVIGGSVPASVAADWLTSAWDQNAGLYSASPAASVVEEAVGAWLIDLLGLPAGTSYGLVSGCQMAHFTCLAAARHAVLEDAGWDVEANGLTGAPEIDVVLGGEAHSTIGGALQYLGLGRDRVHTAAADGQGRMRLDALEATLDAIPPGRPLIVCLQAGNVNTGSFDPIGPMIELVRRRPGAWVHIDGAFGAWARVSPLTAYLLDGAERADSWATDAHKWLNVPYDSGLAFVAHPRAHAAAMAPPHAAYLEYVGEEKRDELYWVPEFSRRARGFAMYAALRSLGRTGVREMVERGCWVARRIADRIEAAPGATILNDVVLNQVLVRFETEDRDPAASDALTRATLQAIQDEGTIWLSGTNWHDMAAIRVSVSNWGTGAEEAELAAVTILAAADRVRARGTPAS